MKGDKNIKIENHEEDKKKSKIFLIVGLLLLSILLTSCAWPVNKYPGARTKAEMEDMIQSGP